MWEDLSMSQRRQLMKIYLGNGVSSLGQMREHYNRFSEGGRPDIPPHGKSALEKASKSSARFMQRVRNPYRETVYDWEDPRSVATHKLSWATDDDGNAIVFPDIQETMFGLHDYTDPRYQHSKWDSYDEALKHNNYIVMTPEEAEWFTENYKDHYPGFKYDDGGHLFTKGGTVSSFGQMWERYNRFANGGDLDDDPRKWLQTMPNPVKEGMDFGVPEYNQNVIDFVSRFNPAIYRALIMKGVPRDRAEIISRFMTKQISHESAYGTSNFALKRNNFGGIGSRDHHEQEETLYFDNIDKYIDYYIDFVRDCFPEAWNANTEAEYAHGLKNKYVNGKPTGEVYYLDSEKNYRHSLENQSSTDKVINAMAYARRQYDKEYERSQEILKKVYENSMNLDALKEAFHTPDALRVQNFEQTRYIPGI